MSRHSQKINMVCNHILTFSKNEKDISCAISNLNREVNNVLKEISLKIFSTSDKNMKLFFSCGRTNDFTVNGEPVYDGRIILGKKAMSSLRITNLYDVDGVINKVLMKLLDNKSSLLGYINK